MGKRDFQKSKVRAFSKCMPNGHTYDSIDLAIKDLTNMYLQLVDFLSIKNKQIGTVPTLLQPHANRTKKSIYSPRKHAIICAVGSLHKRKLIHELCHGLNKQIKKGKRRNIGASHGVNYMTIYICAVALFMFDGDFDYVEQIAKACKCKYDAKKLQHLKQQQTEATTWHNTNAPKL